MYSLPQYFVENNPNDAVRILQFYKVPLQSTSPAEMTAWLTKLLQSPDYKENVFIDLMANHPDRDAIIHIAEKQGALQLPAHNGEGCGCQSCKSKSSNADGDAPFQTGSPPASGASTASVTTPLTTVATAPTTPATGQNLILTTNHILIAIGVIAVIALWQSNKK